MCVQPLVSHIAREQEDCTGHKRDEPDAVLIARLACELHCYVSGELEESWAFLRQPGRRRAPMTPGPVGWSRRGLFRRIRDEPGDLQRTRRRLKQAEADMAALLAAPGLG